MRVMYNAQLRTGKEGALFIFPNADESYV
jgi:hypothetical protein